MHSRAIGTMSLIWLTLISFAGLRSQTLTLSSVARIPWDLAEQRVPNWDGGALGIVQNNDTAQPTIHLFDNQGREMQPVVFSIPGANEMRIEGVAQGLGGVVVVAGRAFDRNGSGGGFISWVSADRQSSRNVQLFPYSPNLLATAPDGTVWVQGHEVAHGMESDPAVNPDNGLIRHFDASGKLIGSFIPRASVPKIKLGLTDGQMASSKDRVAWYANHADAYFEIMYDGGVKEYPGLPLEKNNHGRVTGLALTDAGDAIVSTHEALGASGLYILDRAHRMWKPLARPQNTLTLVYGSAGDSIAVMGKDRFEIAFLKVQPAGN